MTTLWFTMFLLLSHPTPPEPRAADAQPTVDAPGELSDGCGQW